MSITPTPNNEQPTVWRIADKQPEFPCYFEHASAWVRLETWPRNLRGYTGRWSQTQPTETRPTVTPEAAQFHTLAVKEALGTITPTEQKELERLDELRPFQPATAPQLPAEVREMVESPARCLKCGKTTHADTTGVLINRCSCGGELVSVKIDLPSEPLTLAEEYTLQELARKLAENAKGDALKAISTLLRLVVEKDAEIARLHESYDSLYRDNALMHTQLTGAVQRAETDLAALRTENERLKRGAL